jgi:tetratricopeptide (TPR) repeat protein
MVAFQKYFLAVFLWLPALAASAQQTNQDFTSGMASYDRSDWDGAITNFTKSIEATFNLNDSYSYRAYAKAKKGDSDGAIADCNEVIKLNSDCSCGYYWRSRVELELTNYDAALHDFKIGIKLGPKDRPADLADRLSFRCLSFAMEKYEAGDLDGAITNLNEAIYIAPTNPDPYELRGWLKVLQNHCDSAIADEYYAIKYDPKYPGNYEIRAWARYERGDVSGAMKDCKKALEIYAQYYAGGKDKERLDRASLNMEGLQSFINGDFEKASQQWTRRLKEKTNMSSIDKAYFQKWIKKAQAKLQEKKP